MLEHAGIVCNPPLMLPVPPRDEPRGHRSRYPTAAEAMTPASATSSSVTMIGGTGVTPLDSSDRSETV